MARRRRTAGVQLAVAGDASILSAAAAAVAQVHRAVVAVDAGLGLVALITHVRHED
jgi:hypothetical protein